MNSVRGKRVRRVVRSSAIGCLAHLWLLVKGNVKRDDTIDHGDRFEVVKRTGSSITVSHSPSMAPLDFGYGYEVPATET